MWRTGSKLKQCGYSLLEILAVVLFLAVLFAVVPPSLQAGVRGVQIKETARSIAGSLRYTRSLAISKATPHALTVDPAKREYRLAGQLRAGSIPDFLTVEANTGETGAKPAGIGTFVFYPDGSASGGQIALVHRKRLFVIEVDWLTGKVTVRKGAATANIESPVYNNDNDA